MKSSIQNQFVLKIIVEKDNFTKQNYPNNCHIHFDEDSLNETMWRVSTKDYSFIVDETTESGHEVKLFWGEQLAPLKNTEPCEETITEFEKLKRQIDGEKCINVNDLHTVSIVVSTKTAIELSED